MSEPMNLAMQLLAQGMAGIFVVLGIIAITVSVMQKLSNKKDDQ